MHWESWLEKVNTSSDGTDLERSNIDDSLLLDTDKQKKKVPLRMDDDKGGAFDDSGFYNKASWETWLDKNNAIETSHKEGEKKEEWNGKFDNSTTRDGVKDDKAQDKEEPLEELTDGKLEEVEKLKSWELWLEKDALDGKGGNEAKDDLMMPSLMGMYKKPTKQTKEGQARDYLRDNRDVESYHSRRLGHGKKYESGRRPLEKKPQSGGFVNEPRKEEWDITADQDAQQRGSGKNIFDDKDDVEPAGGFIQGQGRIIPKTGKSPKIKPQGKGIKHRGRPRGSMNKAWELFLEKDALDDKQSKVGLPKATEDIMNEAQETIDRDKRGKLNPMYKSWESWLEKMQGAGDARYGNQHLTGMEQKPVDDDESIDLSAESDKNNEKQEKTEDKEGKDNKPYKALS